jgi:hypothetical protein
LTATNCYVAVRSVALCYADLLVKHWRSTCQAAGLKLLASPAKRSACRCRVTPEKPRFVARSGAGHAAARVGVTSCYVFRYGHSRKSAKHNICNAFYPVANGMCVASRAETGCETDREITLQMQSAAIAGS